MPYRSRPDQARNLMAQIEDEMRERLREAIDHVSLEVLVETRRAQGQPHPAADNPADRAEFETGARAFLERLDRDLARDVPEEIRGKLTDGRAGTRHETGPYPLAAQVTLARALPDYWQRFEAIRLAYTAERVRSRGERGGWLRQLFGR
jgi:hypothetical protein